MVVRIRLAVFGRRNRRFYRLYVADARAPRDGKHLECVGHYDPTPCNDGNKHIALNFPRIKYWLSVGAQPTDTVYNLLAQCGVVPPKPPRNYEMRGPKNPDKQRIEQGVDPDELVARELGKADLRELSSAQDEYRDKIRDKLSERAKQLEAERAQKQRLFTLGKLAYERGNYAASLELLEQALRDEGTLSQLGGEIQLWLALAYQAEGRESDCIDTYRRVEASHPNPKIRKQAAELRFIMEAPKLALNPDERVQVPVLTNLDINRNAKPAVSTFRSMKQKTKRKKTLEEQFLENYQPPGWATNRYVWVATVLVASGLAYFSAVARHWL